MRRRLHALVWVGLLSGVFFASCLARRDKPFTHVTDDDAGGPDPIALDGAAPDVSPDALEVAPHAVLGIDPPHGPFVGNTRVMIRGNGFESNARVWFGDVEVDKSKVTPVDPQRIQVETPPGATGAVDIIVQNGKAESTSATLTGGYSYDGFFATPASGPTSGGTVISIEGDNTDWNEQTEVELDRKPCDSLSVLSPTKLACITPAGAVGAKVLSVLNGDQREDVLDGFTYDNGTINDGFVRALWGNQLTDQLTVLVYDNVEGNALPGVAVLMGDDVDSGEVKYTDKSGVVAFSGKLGKQRSVTLALKCFQPLTFYDVPVDHVTAYLDPVLSPACGKFGELPPGGGTPGVGSGISGEVVWAPDEELKRRGWSNVPAPAVDTEKEVAYVFRLADRADEKFRLPSPSSAITRDSEGATGYKFYQSTSPGNFTMYTLAGLEDDSKTPRTFTAYAMGILRGVAVQPGKTADDVYIQVDVPLDHALTLTLDPPTPGARGPDRIRASVAVQIQDQGFALLPAGTSEHALPGAKSFSFVGVPPLVGTLAGTKYVLGARAVTGAGEAPPLSVIGAFSATSTSEPLKLGGFVPLPVLTAPPKNTKWDLSSLSLEASQGGTDVDLTVVNIGAGEGLYTWTLVAPHLRGEFKLPDLSKLAPDAALPVGSMSIETTLASIVGRAAEGATTPTPFGYGTLRYRQMRERGWTAYATDTFFTQH
jgi:IPT/TIG domain